MLTRNDLYCSYLIFSPLLPQISIFNLISLIALILVIMMMEVNLTYIMELLALMLDYCCIFNVTDILFYL